MKHRDVRFDKNKYLHLRELSSKFNMPFSSYEVIGNKIISLDGINKKLLVLEEADGWSNSYTIDLNEVKVISVKKIYSDIKAGELRKRRIEEFLKTINLRFEFKNGNEDRTWSFYESEINKIYDLPRLERKVKNWQMALSKIAGSQNKKLNKEKRQLLFAD